MQRDAATLVDIVTAAELIQSFTDGLEQAEFMTDVKTQSSVLYQLLVIGEAVKRLSADIRQEHLEVPWSLIAGMRDHLIHAYDAVDWGEVWNTVQRDVPDLGGEVETVDNSVRCRSRIVIMHQPSTSAVIGVDRDLPIRKELRCRWVLSVDSHGKYGVSNGKNAL